MHKIALLSLVFNDTIFRITNANEDIDSVEGYFSSIPSMEVSAISVSGTIEGDEVTVKWPISEDESEVSELLTSSRSSKISDLSIFYAVEGGISRKFKGRVIAAEKNPSGKPGYVKIYCRNVKGDFEIPLGLQCLDTCIQVFGECGVDLSLLEESVTIDAISEGGKVITVSAISSEDKRYRNGKIIVKGVAIGIRKADGTDLYLLRKINPSWLDETATLTTGCVHDHESCIFYGNGINNSAFGFSMPKVNPLFESEE